MEKLKNKTRVVFSGEEMQSTFAATLRKSGNSIVLTVPKKVAEVFNLKVGQDVRVTINDMEIET